MGSDLKGWYCILVAMVTESQNSKSSRTANRRPHPEQANLHRSAGAPHRYAPQHISMLNTEDNYLDAFCPDTLFFVTLYKKTCLFLFFFSFSFSFFHHSLGYSWPCYILKQSNKLYYI